MEVKRYDIEGPALIIPQVFEDSRGYFFESFNQLKFEKIIGRKINFIQDNESKSSYGVLRGLHFQSFPYAQAKLLRVAKGKVQDIIVDIRINSPGFGQHISVILSEENKHQLFIPRGFAHGFLVLSEEAIFQYKVDNYYSGEHDSGIAYNDPELNIDWLLPHDEIILSEKDLNLQSLQQFKLLID